MMRYQRVSPDCLPLTNGRKPNLRAFVKEEDADRGRTANCNGIEGKNHRSRPGSTPSTSQDDGFPQFLLSDPSQTENNIAGRSPSNREHAPGAGGDILLQWGQKKRPRGVRADNRSGKDVTSQGKQTIKIHRRPVPGSEKRMVTAAMSPPSVVFSHNKTPNQRSSTGPSHCRNLDERSAAGNGPQLGNEKVRLYSRSAERKSPRSPEKMDGKMGHGAGAEKQKGPTFQSEPINVQSAMLQVEQEPEIAAEKLNMDPFEWPRIYIALSRKEKEDDFLAIKGTKLPQRPKKRAKNVDKTLQYCFPGMWLSDLTRSRYEVREKKSIKKRRRGLKGMESMGSESE